MTRRDLLLAAAAAATIRRAIPNPHLKAILDKYPGRFQVAPSMDILFRRSPVFFTLPGWPEKYYIDEHSAVSEEWFEEWFEDEE